MVRAWSPAAIDLLSWEPMDNQTISTNSAKASGEPVNHCGSVSAEAGRQQRRSYEAGSAAIA